MINFTNKYKDRTPEETIEIIKSFFYRNKLEIKVVENRKTEIGTYSCHVELYKGHNLVLGTNGKGMTEIYSLASGYAELYERFCNKMNYIASVFALRKMEELRELTHFTFAPDEKLEEPSNAIIGLDALYNSLTKIFPNENMLNQFFDIITNGQAICLPYSNINNFNEQIWIDPRATKFILGSVGMAAGNSYAEALTQGISEIYEHIANVQFYSDEQERYYAINLDKIENPELKNIVDVIRNKGYKIYVLDLSYNFNCPVLIAILINCFDKSIYTNFGSHPNFDIAFERIFTELYQGIDNFYITPKVHKPFYDFTLGEIIDKFFVSGSGEAPVIPEYIFDRIEYVDNYNQNIYLPKNCDCENNEILNQYYYNLNEQLGLQMWVRNYGLDPNMMALHILTNSEVINRNKALNYEKMSPLVKASVLSFCSEIKKLTDEFLSDDDIDLKIYKICSTAEISKHNGLDDNRYGSFIGNILWADPLNPIPGINLFLLDNLKSIQMDDNQGMQTFFNTIFHPYYKLYDSLYNYVKCDKYSNEEIKHIFENIFDTEITDEDIANYNNGKYLIQKIYLEPFQEYFNSLEYSELVSSMFIPGLNLQKRVE